MPRTIFELLRSDGCIIVNKNLAHNIGINEAIIYSELISKHSYYEENKMLTKDGLFYVTVEDLQQSTTLSKYQQSKAIAKLEKKGLLKQQNRGVPQKRYFKLIFNQNLLLNYLKDPKKGNEGVKASQTPTEPQKSKNLTFKSEDIKPSQSPMESQKSKNSTFKSQNTSLLKVKKLDRNNTNNNTDTIKQQQPSDIGVNPVVVESKNQEFMEQIEQKDNNLLIELQKLGFSSKKAKEIVKRYDEEKINKIVKHVQADSKIKNKAGFIIKAIENDYIIPEIGMQQKEDYLKAKTEKYLREMREAEKNADIEGFTRFLQSCKPGKILSMT